MQWGIVCIWSNFNLGSRVRVGVDLWFSLEPQANQISCGAWPDKLNPGKAGCSLNTSKNFPNTWSAAQGLKLKLPHVACWHELIPAEKYVAANVRPRLIMPSIAVCHLAERQRNTCKHKNNEAIERTGQQRLNELALGLKAHSMQIPTAVIMRIHSY